MKAAVIFESSPFDRKGLFNAVHERVRHLVASDGLEVDVYCVHSRDNSFTRTLRHTPRTQHLDNVEIEGVTYRMLWYRFSLTDYFLLEKLHHHPLFFIRFIKKNLEELKGYDAVIAHSFTGALFAYAAHCCYDIPYYVTWHGSDIHTHPWRNPVILEDTRLVMRFAVCNFFVSHALMAESERILTEVPKEVLYNGVSEHFFRFPDVERIRLRTGYGLSPDDKVVAFVGNLAAVKNVMALPDIFAEVAGKYDGPVKFWIVGDGKLRDALEASVRHCGRNMAITFFGNVPSPEMPAMMNCIDVLVLPSLNEGLPLVCAEAIRCGANVVGSASGGIPEVAGMENTFSLGEGFVENISGRIIDMLSTEVLQSLPEELDWGRTCARELSAILRS